MYQLQVHKVDELLDIWHGLQQSAVDSAIDGEREFVPAYGPKEDILSSDNVVNGNRVSCSVIEEEKQCSKFVEYVFQIS